jgi:hypothetical protein
LPFVCASLLFWTTVPAQESTRPGRGETARPVIERVPLRYQIIARSPRLNRKVLGEVTERVRGVPAQPVDSMVYDGDGSVPIEGMAMVEVDPGAQRGLVRARWKDENGEWEMLQTYFHHPEHLSGIRIGPGRNVVEDLINLGTAQNVYLHGDTGAGTPILPTVFTYLATWGMVNVTLDGEPFENPYGFPGPRWMLHCMLTEGVRGEDGTVRAQGGEIFDPMKHKDKGVTDPGDLELHLEFQDERLPRTANRPSMFSFQYHLVFEDVVLKITDSQEPLDFDAVVEWEEGVEGAP